jgi:hypothetical protein
VSASCTFWGFHIFMIGRVVNLQKRKEGTIGYPNEECNVISIIGNPF